MGRSRWERDLDLVVRRTDPILGWRLNDEGVASSLEDVGLQILQNVSPARPRQRRRALRAPRRLVVFVVMLLGVSGVAAAATGVFVNAQTHRYLHGWERRAAGPGEILNSAGTNYDQVVLRDTAGISYPASYASWRDFAVRASRPRAKCPSGSPPGCTVNISTGLVEAEVAESAFAAWVLDWRHAKITGSRAAVPQAAAVITEAPHWKAITDFDATAHGYFSYLRPFVRAVKAGNLSEVDRLIASDTGGASTFWTSDPTFSRYAYQHPANTGPAFLRYLKTGRL